MLTLSDLISTGVTCLSPGLRLQTSSSGTRRWSLDDKPTVFYRIVTTKGKFPPDRTSFCFTAKRIFCPGCGRIPKSPKGLTTIGTTFSSAAKRMSFLVGRKRSNQDDAPGPGQERSGRSELVSG